MKQSIGYVVGAAAAISLMGMLFKLMHFPGANILLILGLGTLATTCVVWGLISSDWPRRLGGFAIAFFVAAYLFRMMHWEGHWSISTAALAFAIATVVMLLIQRRDS